MARDFYSSVNTGSIVVGVCTKARYIVERKELCDEAAEHGDVIQLRALDIHRSSWYTRQQFNHHFRSAKARTKPAQRVDKPS